MRQNISKTINKYIWNEKSISEALGLKIDRKLNLNKVRFNSLDIEPHDIFIPLIDKRDGHDFIDDALNRGAGLILSSRKDKINNDKIILVDDTYESLIKLAKYKRSNLKAKFIGITGSVGKTTTKEIITKSISYEKKIYSSSLNYNNQIGLPCELASMGQDYDYGIFELGMSNKGDISFLANILRPEIAIITAISVNHIENLGSIENIALEKLQIASQNDCKIVIINDDESMYEFQKENLYKIILNTTNNRSNLSNKNNFLNYNLYNFGSNKNSNSYINNSYMKDDKWYYEMKIFDHTHIIELNRYSASISYGVLISLMLLKILNINNKYFLENTKYINHALRRGEEIIFKIDNKNIKLIDDSYNSSPLAVKAACEYLSKIKKIKKILIMGDMLGLGSYSEKAHLDLEEIIVNSSIYKLITVGDQTELLHNNIKNKDYFLSLHYNNVDDLIKELIPIIKDADLVYLKASNAINLYKLANYIKDKFT